MDPLLLIAHTRARQSLSLVQLAILQKEASPVEMMRSVAKVMLTRQRSVLSQDALIPLDLITLCLNNLIWRQLRQLPSIAAQLAFIVT